MSRNSLSKDLKILFARSGNKCAFPGCSVILVIDKTDSDKESIIGDIAHIESENPTAARYNPNMTDKERNSYDNLILLCKNHHKVIDDQRAEYTVQKLKEMKSTHEKRIVEAIEREIPNVTFEELNIVTKYLVAGQFSEKTNYKLIPPQDKINRNGLSSTIEHLIVMGMIHVKQVADFVNNYPDFEFSERLVTGFVTEYNKLRKDDELEGDNLFLALLDFATGKNNEFKYKAAGLEVLVYLFEKCEVFEK